MQNPKRLFALIVIVSAISLYIALPQTVNLDFDSGPVSIHRTINRPGINVAIFGRRFQKDFILKLGLDLQGGTHLVLDADMSDIAEADRLDALESSREVIARRVDLFGVSEPVIQTSIRGSDYRLIVELPGIKDTNQAVGLIGQTAKLDFRNQDESSLQAIASPSALDIYHSFIPTQLTGADLKKASVQFDNQTGEPVVAIEFTPEGGNKFATLTKENIGKRLGIFLDGDLVTAPTVQTEIGGGQGVISGSFTLESAKNLSIQLNAGALPVPIRIIEQRNVGATLGQQSVTQSLRAGAVGLIMVMVFMAAYYGYQGLLADLALAVYAVITLALYKFLGITITLPGLAGFILSVGMAVDSNILIFERTKEEIRSGKNWRVAMELGFGRAWDSIKDANAATLTTCFILFNPLNWDFLNSSGLVRGFALTLALGIVISLFTGIIVTRTLMRLFYQGKGK